MRVLFIIPYPLDIAPSQRFRFEQYINVLKSNNINPSFAPFLDINTWNILYKKGNFNQKIFGVIKGFLNRILLLTSVYKYQYIFIHREAAPFGPPLFEWIIGRITRKRIIYDFDDAIWLSDKHKGISKWIKNTQKVDKIIRLAHKISCGNQYLFDHARALNRNVVINPTTIDTKNYHNRLKTVQTGELVIGWTGTHSTLKYLKMVVPVLEKLARIRKVKILIICNQKPYFNIPNLEFVYWSKEKEVEDLLKIDIGIMPLENDAWSKGKCGFKVLQYMSLAIPVVASPVGVNNSIVENSKNGYLCDTEKEWLNALLDLIDHPETRSEFGLAARRKVENNYSVIANQQNFLNLFRN